MNRHQKISTAVTAGVSLVVVVVLAAAFGWSWGSGAWPHGPPAELFVTAQPKQEDVAGVYQLIQQTITADGLAVLAGRTCELELRSDGTFTVTNYPKWSAPGPGVPPRPGFVSTTGRWRCDKLGIISNDRECWGVVFSDSQEKIPSLALRSKGSPYDLMFMYGDADEGKVMTFGKKK